MNSPRAIYDLRRALIVALVAVLAGFLGGLTVTAAAPVAPTSFPEEEENSAKDRPAAQITAQVKRRAGGAPPAVTRPGERWWPADDVGLRFRQLNSTNPFTAFARHGSGMFQRC